MHVPEARRAAFDEAIDSIGQDGPLYHAWLEPSAAPHQGLADDTDGALAWHGPGDGRARALVRVDGHLEWEAPCASP
jgi:hypothetical protein